MPITILDIMNLKEPFVITISREIGSGGHTVGQMLAEKLDTRFCDKDLIRSLEKKRTLSTSSNRFPLPKPLAWIRSLRRNSW